MAENTRVPWGGETGGVGSWDGDRDRVLLNEQRRHADILIEQLALWSKALCGRKEAAEADEAEAVGKRA